VTAFQVLIWDVSDMTCSMSKMFKVVLQSWRFAPVIKLQIVFLDGVDYRSLYFDDGGYDGE